MSVRVLRTNASQSPPRAPPLTPPAPDLFPKAPLTRAIARAAAVQQPFGSSGGGGGDDHARAGDDAEGRRERRDGAAVGVYDFYPRSWCLPEQVRNDVSNTDLVDFKPLEK